MPYVGDKLAKFSVEGLYVSGALDTKYTTIGRDIFGKLPNFKHVIVEGAGHNVHIEKPQIFEQAVLDFYRRKVKSMSKFDWKVLDRNYEDVIYETYNGIAKITINRPEVRNAFRPKTVMELIDAFTVAREDNEVGVIVLTGANHGKGEDKEAFCSGGDQKCTWSRWLCW